MTTHPQPADTRTRRGPLRALRAVPASRHHLWLMLTLTFATGIIDAVGFLGLDRVFTGNMTGNVVILGMGLTGADDLPVLGPTLALIGFIVGAATAGRILATASTGWTRRTTILFTLTAFTEIAAGITLLTDVDPGGRSVQLIITTLVGAGMGVQAAAARHIAVKDVTTVVVTSTLTGLAADTLSGTGNGSHAGRRVAAILLILVGAGVGAALLQWHLSAGFIAAGLLTAATACIGAVHVRQN